MKPFYRSLLFCLFSFSFLLSQAQDLQEVVGRISDAQNGKPLPFATLVTSSGLGSTTDEEGYFKIKVKAAESLRISYVGYQTKEISLADSSDFLNIALVPLVTEIQTVNISAKNDYLYKLVAYARFSLAQKSDTARAYYSLATTIDDAPIERMEAYYNANIQGYDLQNLKLKNGRIGIRPFKERYFVSVRSTYALLLHKLTQQPDYFPESPIGLGKGRLKRNFKLQFDGRYWDEKGNRIYRIAFEPLKDKERSFSGTLWVDSARKAFVKVELRKQQTATHPFLPLFKDGEIESADIFIRKQFTLKGNWYYLQSVDFEYHLDYRSRKDELQKIKTKALLYAYDYDRPFLLPRFEFPEGLTNEYRQINALPHQSEFWDHPERFQLPDIAGETQAFFTSSKTHRAKDALQKSRISKHHLFEHPYSIWNGQRIVMRNEPIKHSQKPSHYNQFEVNVRADLYQFKVQLFLDLTQWQDSLSTHTAAIFDPYQSFYRYEQDSLSAVVLNLYFDLAEVYRRKLAQAIEKENKRGAILAAYRKVKEAYQAEAALFLADVELGQNRFALRSWNDKLRQETGIDNIALFWREKRE
ncbi:MAG: carboxypeptidase-like regulatory domain-containing protein [Vicingaceae bacterium]